MDQDILCAYEALEVAELLILIVVAASRHTVNIVKDLYPDDGVDIEEKDEKRHEAKNNRHDFQNSFEDILQFSVYLEVYLLRYEFSSDNLH